MDDPTEEYLTEEQRQAYAELARSAALIQAAPQLDQHQEPIARKYAPFAVTEPGALCDACYATGSRTPAAVTIDALWASGSASGAEMPLCWQHLDAWREKVQPTMAQALADEPDAWLDLPRTTK
jgi:hypothetical protein